MNRAESRPPATPRRIDSIDNLAVEICAWAGSRSSTQRALLVALSGIDGSGKSHMSQRLASAIEATGLRVALIGIDPWQNPQSIRFGGEDPGRHFYEHVIRFGDLFTQLVEPLVAARAIHLQTRGMRTDRDVWDELIYDFENIDIVLLEGILLFKRDFVRRYDLRIWIDCTFETAVHRALERNVEALPPERLRQDYDRVYHAAQRYHFDVDEPLEAAELILPNDDLRRRSAARGAVGGARE